MVHHQLGNCVGSVQMLAARILPRFNEAGAKAFAYLVLVKASAGAVSSALLCVSLLTIIFFGVYLALVVLRLVAFASKRGGGKVLRAEWLEAALCESTEGLSTAPMFCIALLVARLRTLQLGFDWGGSSILVQISMYVGTLSLLCSCAFKMQCTETGDLSGPKEKLVKVSRIGCDAALYGCVAIIIVSALASRATGAADPAAFTPPLLCAIVLASAFFVRQFFDFLIPTFERTSGSPPRAGSSLRLRPMLFDGLLPMFCVLLVAIALRCTQLELRMALWAQICMYLSTAMLVGDALWGARPALEAAFAEIKSRATSGAASGTEGGGSGGGGGGVVADRPSVGAWTGLPPPLAAAVSGARAGASPDISWKVRCCAMGGLTLAVGLTLVGVGCMEAAAEAPARAHPLSAAMRCVMLLTVMFFGVRLFHMGKDVAEAVRRAKAGETGPDVQGTLHGNIQQALAFAPALCVAMIAVRLRSMQLGMQDPAGWAQFPMYAATASVAVQVACSLQHTSPGEELEPAWAPEESATATRVAAKVGAIMLAVLRYAASATMYVAISALVLAIFAMEVPITSSAQMFVQRWGQ